MPLSVLYERQALMGSTEETGITLGDITKYLAE